MVVKIVFLIATIFIFPIGFITGGWYFFKRKDKFWGILLTSVGALSLVLLIGLGSTGNNTTNESAEVVASSESAQKPTAVPTSPPVDEVISTTAPLPSPIPTEPPVTDKTISLEGSGQSASEVFFLESGLHIARVKASSSDLITIHMSNASGYMVGGPLVSRMSPFDTFNGSTAFGLALPGNYILEVDTDGNWKVEIWSDLTETDSDFPLSMKGDNQAASEMFRLEEGSYVAQIKGEGEGHLSVWLMNELGVKIERLVNEFGQFDGSTAFDVDRDFGYILDVSSDGNWSITIDKK